ncbi:hypothetical protein F7725_007196 [Dissostichus mawsoni]|uniref:Uncharacterized protein n=1 Tax=Dissostichus mawsoni TaxID=36200 RepID=A0A7J5XW33_DISMA|nr:hypothetical protein F7725_007196 [Dissostichus mawsoni]
MAVSLQGGQQDVDEPEGEEEEEGEELGCPWAPELSARHAGTPAVDQHHHTHQRHDGEHGDGEGQRAGVHLEHLAFGLPVNSGDGPRHPDTQEHVDGVAARHVADGGVSVLVLDGSRFTRKCICNRNIRHQNKRKRIHSNELVIEISVSTLTRDFRTTNDSWSCKGSRQLRHSAEGHKHHGGDRVLEPDGAAEVTGQVPGHSCQDADEGNGHKETRPAIPVLSGGDKSEEDFPENCQEVHNVVKAGRQALLPAVFLVVVTWQTHIRCMKACKNIYSLRLHAAVAVFILQCSPRHKQMRHLTALRLTCTDSDSTNKLLPPAAAPHHQSQVRLLYQLVHCALQTATKKENKRT